MKIAVVLFVAIATIISGAHGSGKTAFGYTGSNGPSAWPKMFPTCNGKKQSPINIESANVRTEFWKPFTFMNYNEPPTRMRIKNNGHTAQVEIDAKNAPRVSNGGLKGEFVFAQFHFHWGNESDRGSEHTIDGVRYPMELHFVHYNTKYDDLAQAVKYADGLAVLGILFQISETDNAALTPLVNTLKRLTDPGNYIEIPSKYPLQAFLPNDLEQFYRYEGSLTTPTCNEVVTWTVFGSPASVSEQQMRVFRSLKTADLSRAIVDNFRPPQPINSRRVFRAGTGSESAASDNSLKKIGMGLYFMSSMAVMLMNM